MSRQRSTIIRITAAFREFLLGNTAGGVILLVCTAVALTWANSPWSGHYFELWELPVTIGIGAASLTKTLSHWINDGLMVLFFFFVGLEIKRELITGELSTVKKAMLPLLAALGGMIGPALIYSYFNAGSAETARGWGIPMATDIAFALGILALLGDRVPAGLKVFLAALAIADDMGAVVVIALFYTQELSLMMLGIGGGFLLLLMLANRMNIRTGAVYAVLGTGLWFCFLKSGIHATIAGVLLAATIPIGTKEPSNAGSGHSLLHRFEHALQPYVTFLIMPVFAFANAGVAIQGSIIDALRSPVGLGVSIGLIAGKQLGIFSVVWLAVKANAASLPANVTWPMIYATTWLCAIGFTMSLFIANLAFTTPEPLVISKIAILSASAVAALVGYLLLSRLKR